VFVFNSKHCTTRDLDRRWKNYFLICRSSIVGDFSNFMRVSIAFYEVPELKLGIEKLCKATEAVIKRKIAK